MTGKRKKTIRALLWPKQRGLCCYCRTPMVQNHKSHDPRRVTVEHLRRLCDGGSSHLDNLALACQDCNVRRGSIDWLTYTSLKRGEVFA